MADPPAWQSGAWISDPARREQADAATAATAAPGSRRDEVGQPEPDGRGEQDERRHRPPRGRQVLVGINLTDGDGERPPPTPPSRRRRATAGTA